MGKKLWPPDVDKVGPAAMVRWFDKHPSMLRDDRHVMWLGVYQLWLDRYSDAQHSFAQAIEGFARTARDVEYVNLDLFGLKFVAHWLEGDRNAAVECLTVAMEKSHRRHVACYAGLRAGFTIGLLMWFAAREMRDTKLASKAETDLRFGAKWRNGHWPQPLARLVLGEIAPEEFSKSVLGVDDLFELETRPEGTIRITDMSTFRHPDELQSLYFYLGLMTRPSRARTKGRALLHRVACTKPHGPECEWYLARQLCGMTMSWQPTDALLDRKSAGAKSS
ncbi:MAG TPA: hypothetical protein PK264_02085 [Hyphomicrobiaceae bacterium]|nr:hypothetical protein [Hyphomicrobiaceae bacterium]